MKKAWFSVLLPNFKSQTFPIPFIFLQIYEREVKKSRNIHNNQHLIKVNNNIKRKHIIKDLQRIINEEEERPINLMGF